MATWIYIETGPLWVLPALNLREGVASAFSERRGDVFGMGTNATSEFQMGDTILLISVRLISK